MAKKKPLIALTPYFNIERDEPYMRPAYLKAIRAAGSVARISRAASKPLVPGI